MFKRGLQARPWQDEVLLQKVFALAWPCQSWCVRYASGRPKHGKDVC